MNFDNFGSFGIMNDYDCMDEPSFFKWSLIFKVMLDQRSVLSSFLGFFRLSKFETFGSFGIVNGHWCSDWCFFFKWSLFFSNYAWPMVSFELIFSVCPNSTIFIVLESSVATDMYIDVFISNGHFFFKLCLTNCQFWAIFFSLSKFENFL